MRVVYEEFEASNRGIIANTEQLAEMARKFSGDWDIIQVARQICQSYQADGKVAMNKADAIFYWTKRNIKYIHDPISFELFQDPKVLLKERMGDCDCMVLFCCAVNMAVGNLIRVVLLASGAKEDEFDHVYFEVLCDNGWRAYDTTVDRSSPGWEPPYYVSKMAIYPDGQKEWLGFIDKIIKELKRFFHKFEKNIIRRPFHEIKDFAKKNFEDIYEPVANVARKIRDEKRRFEERIARELGKFTSSLGPLGQIVSTAIKVVGTVVASNVLGAVAGKLLQEFGLNANVLGSTTVEIAFQVVKQGSVAVLVGHNKSPFHFTTEDWAVIINISLAVVSAGALSAGNLTALATTQIIESVKTGIEVTQAIKEKKALLEEVKKVKAQVLLQEQALFEIKKKLEKDIEFLEVFQQRQEQFARELRELQEENNIEIAQIEEIEKQKMDKRLADYRKDLLRRKQDIIDTAKLVQGKVA